MALMEIPPFRSCKVNLSKAPAEIGSSPESPNLDFPQNPPTATLPDSSTPFANPTQSGIEILPSAESLIPKIPELGHVESVPDSRSPSSVLPENPNSSLPWAARFKSSLRNLRKSATPQYTDNGTPVVMAPPSVLLKGSEQWTDYLVAVFSTAPPPPEKIFSDLNPIWGKYGNISLRRKSHNSFLIFIPNKSTRDWVTQIGYWQSDNCGFSVTPWSPSGVLQDTKLTSVPIWVKLLDIPLELQTLEGISVIASAIGEPLHTEGSRLNLSIMGEAKLKVEIQVNTVVPETIIVKDEQGNTANITAFYPRLPPKCTICEEFGHLAGRCSRVKHKKSPSRHPPPVIIEAPKGLQVNAGNPTPTPKLNETHLVTNKSGSSSRSFPLESINKALPMVQTNSILPIERSSSLPPIPQQKVSVISPVVGSPKAIGKADSKVNSQEDSQASSNEKENNDLEPVSSSTQEADIISSAQLILRRRPIASNHPEEQTKLLHQTPFKTKKKKKKK